MKNHDQRNRPSELRLITTYFCQNYRQKCCEYNFSPCCSTVLKDWNKKNHLLMGDILSARNSKIFELCLSVRPSVVITTASELCKQASISHGQVENVHELIPFFCQISRTINTKINADLSFISSTYNQDQITSVLSQSHKADIAGCSQWS